MMKVLAVGALLLALTAGVAVAVNKVCPEGTTSSDPCKGTTGNDLLVGTTGADYISALAGNDKVFGYNADPDQSDRADRIDGSSGNDYLWGGLGDDTLWGGGGDDVLDGGRGEDTIRTGRGFDVVYAKDGYKDIIDCNEEGGYFIANWDEGLDTDMDGNTDMCPGFNPSNPSAASVTSASDGGSSSTEGEGALVLK